MRLALAQPAAGPADPFPTQLASAVEAVAAAGAARAELVVFSELYLGGYRPDELRRGELTTVLAGAEDARLDPLRQAVADAGLAVASGAAVRHRAGGPVYNAILWFTPGGDARVVYRKLHLWGDEWRVFTPGTDLAGLDWAGVRIGFGVCFDAGFPDFARAYAPQCQLLVFASAFAAGAERHRYQIYHPARALETGCHLAVANAWGEIGETSFFGESTVLDPWGHALAKASGSGITLAEIDPARCERARAELPYLTTALRRYPTPTTIPS